MPPLYARTHFSLAMVEFDSCLDDLELPPHANGNQSILSPEGANVIPF